MPGPLLSPGGKRKVEREARDKRKLERAEKRPKQRERPRKNKEGETPSAQENKERKRTRET